MLNWLPDDKNLCECVDALTLCWIFNFLCVEFLFFVAGKVGILVISLIGAKRSSQSRHLTASRTTIPYSGPPHKRHQKQNTLRKFFLAVVYENIHNLSPSDRG